jgi:ParB family chromosome partitioning protein
MATQPTSLLDLPLNSLILSALNVRHTERDAEIASLAEDIAARGLKQNLVVVPAHFSTGEARPVAERSEAEPTGKTDWQDKWEVIAGGRRLQAMQLLLADGRLPVDHLVPCLIEDRADASETSLSENLHKVSMNPADEFAAFHAIVEQRRAQGEPEDEAIAYTARRFGVTVKHVQGRLRLATLAPEILEALRANEITLDIAKAYAGTSDHDVQRTVFKAAKKSPYALTAKDIRNRLRGVTCSLDDPRMEFVGLIAYRAAGGRTETEMFMGTEGEERVVDVALLDKLVKEKGEELAAAAAKTDGWKSAIFTFSYAYSVKKPEGFAMSWGGADQLSKTKRKQCIAIYIARGDGIELQAHLEPMKPAEEAPRRDWEAERREHEREMRITRSAARLAAREVQPGLAEMFIASPESLIWPTGYAAPVERDDDETFVLVTLQIRLPVSELEARREEATRLIEAAEAVADEADEDDDREFSEEEAEA